MSWHLDGTLRPICCGQVMKKRNIVTYGAVMHYTREIACCDICHTHVDVELVKEEIRKKIRDGSVFLGEEW